MMDSSLDADIVVIGAGIHGVAVASEASRRGYRVTVLEQYDQAARGTSSRSSKLIHGGLRYLESLELSLVHECLGDRRRLLGKYPDLVKMQKFFIPVYRNSSRSSFLIRLGLSLYALLGGLDSTSRFHKLGKHEWAGLPRLSKQGLVDVFQYYDAQTDDAALTRRILGEAEDNGVKVIFNACFQSCDSQGDSLKVVYRQREKDLILEARYLVNAAGPWVNQVIEKCRPAFSSLPVELVQGSHVEIPGNTEEGIYYLEAPQDKRAVFVMPWQGHLLLGTTESPHQGDPSTCQPSPEEIDYLLEVYNHYFSEAGEGIGSDKVIDSWAGLRVLPRGDGRPFSRSRETIFHPNRKHRPNIVSIYGGKLTSHYSTALKLLKMLDLEGEKTA